MLHIKRNILMSIIFITGITEIICVDYIVCMYACNHKLNVDINNKLINIDWPLINNQIIEGSSKSKSVRVTQTCYNEICVCVWDESRNVNTEQFLLNLYNRIKNNLSNLSSISQFTRLWCVENLLYFVTGLRSLKRIRLDDLCLKN